MKKVFLFLALTVSMYVKAQDKVSFTVKAGANFATWTLKQQSGLKMTTGYHAGGAASIPLGRGLFVQPELFYSREGTKFGEGAYDLGYINVPLLLQYRHISGFHVETGPQLGVLLHTGLKDADIESEELKKFTNQAVGSWCMGMGVKLQPGIDIYTRYTIGISSVVQSTEKITSNVISVGLAYWF